jgi:hypothetical protein
LRNSNNKKINVVIGCSLPSLLFAYKNNLNLLYTRNTLPSKIEKNIFFEGDEYTPHDLWKRLYYILSLSGNILFSDKIDNIRLEEETLSVFTKRARKYIIEYDKVYVFDDLNLYGIPDNLSLKEDSILEIRDWFDVKSGMKHEYNLLTTDSEFVNKIIFHQSDRIDGNHDLKDAVAISYLTKEQLDDFEYSDINARFKTKHVMKQAGIKGTRNGRDTKNKALYKYYAIRLENREREIVYKLKNYKSTDRLVFKYESVDDIIGDESENSYARRVFSKYK